jgi:hypothetical protein
MSSTDDVNVNICAHCSAQCGKSRCPCLDAFYCGAECQNKDWREHRKFCIVHRNVITRESLTLPKRLVARLLHRRERDQGDHFLRKIHRNNGPNISINIDAGPEPAIFIREKKRPNHGVGSVSILDTSTRELTLYRYELRHAYNVLQFVVKDVAGNSLRRPRVIMKSDFDNEVVATLLGTQSVIDDEVDYVEIYRDQRSFFFDGRN